MFVVFRKNTVQNYNILSKSFILSRWDDECDTSKKPQVLKNPPTPTREYITTSEISLSQGQSEFVKGQ